MQVKDLMRRSKKGVVCPTCSHLEDSEQIIETAFGYGFRIDWVCAACGESLTVFKNVETTFATYVKR